MTTLLDSYGQPLLDSFSSAGSIVPKLAARALRKLGLAIVADASRPDGGPTLSTADIVRRVVHALGIPVVAADRPAELGTTTEADSAARALRLLGVNPIAGVSVEGLGITPGEVATRALRMVGVNPADLPVVASGIVWTYQQVATEALRRLSVVDSIEFPVPPDQLEAEKHALATHDMLSGMAYVDWSASTIPNSVAEAYIALTANILGPMFGKVSAADVGAAAQEMVRQQALAGQVAQNRALARVSTVHERLRSEGLADWTIDQIHAAVGDAYVVLVAIQIAPIHGKQIDPQAEAAAMAQVRRFVLSGPRGQTLAVDAVRSAHDSLVRAGVVSWTTQSIPVGVVNDYAMLAAAVLAPTYGREQADAFPAIAEKLRRQAEIAQAETRAGEKVQSVYSELNAMGVVDWPYGAVPAAVADAIASMAVALMRADEGKADPAAMEAGFQRVRQVAMAGPAGQRIAEQKVRAVHYSLEARGKTRWSLLDIPRFAEEPYVFLAASLLAPEVGMKADPVWAIGAEMELNRAIALPSLGGPVVGVYF